MVDKVQNLFLYIFTDDQIPFKLFDFAKIFLQGYILYDLYLDIKLAYGVQVEIFNFTIFHKMLGPHVS